MWRRPFVLWTLTGEHDRAVPLESLGKGRYRARTSPVISGSRARPLVLGALRWSATRRSTALVFSWPGTRCSKAISRGHFSISKENSVVARQTIFHPFFWRAGAREQALDDSHWGTLMVSPAPPRPAPPRPAPGSGSNRQCAKAKLTFFPRECVCINIVYGSPTSRILSNSIVDILRVLPRRLRKNFCPRGLRGGPCDPAWVQPPQSVNSFCEKAWKVITT